MPRMLDGLERLTGRFDVFLVDQFGVLLDGGGAFAGAAAALSRLAQAGKSVVIVSNSGKRSAENAARLVGLGFAPDSFRAVVSSGEAAHRHLSARIGQDLPAGAEVLLLARDGDRSPVDGLALRLTDDPARAALVLLAGSRGDEMSLPQYEALLAPAARRRTPCLCANPDMVMLTARGPRFGAGAIADLYQRLGGPVTRVGKPYPEIYRAALAAAGLGQTADRSRVVCLGDSPEHDILGGAGAGLATALVRTGVSAGQTRAQLEARFAATGARPDFVLPGFVFSR